MFYKLAVHKKGRKNYMNINKTVEKRNKNEKLKISTNRTDSSLK